MDKSDKNKTIKALEEAGIDPTQLDPEAFTLIDAKAEKDYFNTEEYQTVLVDLEKNESLEAESDLDANEGFQANSETNANAAASENLKQTDSQPVSHTGLSPKAIDALKKQPNAAALLLKAINQATDTQLKTKLLIACWDSGIDCREYLNSYIQIAIEAPFECTLEVFSIVDAMDFPIETAQIKMAQETIDKAAPTIEDPLKKDMLLQIKGLLNQFIE